MSTHLRVGQRVRLPNESLAVIRFLGETDFKEGEWVGLELDDAVGKNNGTIDGRQYFECREKHGMFMRPLPTIEVLEQPKPESKPESKPELKALKRPISLTPKPSTTALTATAAARTRQSVTAMPNKRMSTVASASTNTVAKRQSMAPPSSSLSSSSSTTPRSSRLSLAARSVSPKKPMVPITSQPSSRSSLGPARLSSVRSTAVVSSPSPSLDRVRSPGSSTGESANRLGRTAPQPSSQPAKPSPQYMKQVEELQTKVKFLEKKRMEDRDKLKELEALREKKNHFEVVIQKLQSKCQAMHQESTEMKKNMKTFEDRTEELESIQAEHDSIMELATLDREMAEEKAESFRTELEAIKGHLEEMELENEILRDENEELGKDMSPDERASQGWVQMQRENDRLRQALLRLRDWSQEQEAQLKNEIKSLEEDSQELSEVRGKFEDNKVRLLESEAEAEDLREQLDAALGAESMIEQLTEKNLSITEQMEDLRKTVEHLQDLKELNDELEINHTEHEKQLLEAIDFKDSLISEQLRRSNKQDEELADREYTITRFRDLVTNLQTDLDDMRSSKQISEMEAQNLENSSRAIMDLNRQLQASANSATVKALDMELRKMEAEEASEHLAIVQLFLPEAFQSERDAVLALLRFRRIAFKSRLLHGFVKQRVGGPDAHLHMGENVYTACDALDKLTWMSAMCERFTAAIRSSPPDQFIRFESTLYELEPVERSLNGYIENLRRDELREPQVVEGLQRSIAVLKHLAETYLAIDLESYAEEILMKTLLMQSSLENIATALVATKSEILSAAPPSNEDDEEMLFEQQADSTISESRSAKVMTGKVQRKLQDMKSRSMSLDPETISLFDNCSEICDKLCDFSRQLGVKVNNVIHEVERDEPLAFNEVSLVMRTLSSSFFGISNTEIFTPMQGKLHSLIETLSDLNNLAADLSQMTEFEKPPAPWVLRSKELQTRKAISAMAEEEIKTLKRELQERATSSKMREQKLEESDMKIELLEKRMKDASGKIDRIVELEALIEQSKERETSMEKAVEKQQEFMSRLEDERDRWMKKAAEVKTIGRPGDDTNPTADLVGSAAEMDVLKDEIKVLQSTNRYLRHQTRRKIIEEDAHKNSWLSMSLAPSEKPKTLQSAENMMAVLENLATLPAVAKPLRLGDLGQKDRQKWQPMKKTPKYQLVEQEMQWLKAWDPLGPDWRGIPQIVGLDGIDVVG